MKKISKTKLAKNLGVSRPTLYKMIKNKKDVTTPYLEIELQKQCINFSARNCHISPKDLENILEDLQDFGLLSDDGIRFRSNYWKLFVQE